MTDSDDKPRKTLRLKRAPDAAQTPAGPRKPPVRWNPLTRDRRVASKATDDRAPAEGKSGAKRATKPGIQARTRPAGKAVADAGAPATGKPPRPHKTEATPSENRRRARPGTEPGAGDSPDASRARATTRPPRDERRTHFVDRKQARPAPRPAAYAFFAPCPRGLEDELAKELDELGVEAPQATGGGVAFEGDLVLAWRVNLWSRLAIRVLWRLKTGRYLLEDDLYEAAKSVDWPSYFTVDKTIAVTTVARSSPLKSLNFASLKVKDAVCDRFREVAGSRPDVEGREPQAPILLYLNKDEYSLYLDLTGAPLNRRGFRLQPAQAPLNENLAAGLLRLAGWTPDQPLLDPMMGGGTILLEAGLMALNRAPGLRRHFAFEHLTSFDKVEWAKLRKTAESEAQEPRRLPIYGCDSDPAMVRAATINLRAAGLLDCVALDEGDALAVPAPEDHGVLISNPPYGVRLSVDDMAALYTGLGDALKQRFAGWRAYFISADPELPKQIGLRASRRVPLYNGPLECRLYEYVMVAGSHRKDKPAHEA